MIGVPYNPDVTIFLLSQSLNASQFNPNVPDTGNKTTHNLLFDTNAKTLIWVDTKTNLIVQETAAGGGEDTPLTTFALNTNNPDRIYDLSKGNYAYIEIQGQFKNFIQPVFKDNLDNLILNGNQDIVNLSLNDYIQLSTMQLNLQGGFLNSDNFLTLPKIAAINSINKIENTPLFSIKNNPLLVNISNIGAKSINFVIEDNALLGAANFNQDYYGIENLYVRNNPIITDVRIGGSPSLSFIEILNCPLLTSFRGFNVFIANEGVTNFNFFVGNTIITTLYFINAINCVDVDISGMTSLIEIDFSDCALNTSAIENILTNLDSFGLNNGTCNLIGGSNAAIGSWTPASVTAKNNLVLKGWSVTNN
jgi:hypothetical protein